MTRRNGRTTIYTVVQVWRGIAASVKNFTRLKEAENYMRRLRRGRNLDEDDIQLFENSIRF